MAKMADVQSTVTELPANCKSAAERVANILAEEDQYADLTEICKQKITNLEAELAKETGEHVALVAYRV